jgi:hypothetical protein
MIQIKKGDGNVLEISFEDQPERSFVIQEGIR